MSPFFAVLPPILVLAIGIFTRRILLSLVAGVLLSAFISKNFAIVPGIQYACTTIWQNSDIASITSISSLLKSDSLCICFFLLILGILITAIQETGGALAFLAFIQKFLKGRKQIEGSSIFLSMCFFIDDYFSCLTVGSVMHGITDTYRIARAKLAFLADTLSAPLAILCPFSAWVAAVMGFMMDSGINLTSHTHQTLIFGSPFAVYIESIPFTFYSFIALFSCIFIAALGISYGPMYHEEQEALHHNPHKDPATESVKGSEAMIDFALPIFLMIISVFVSMLYTGDHHLFGGKNDFFVALHNARGSLGLFLGGLTTLLVSLVFFLARKKITMKQLGSITMSGSHLMLSSIYVLVLSWSLGDLMSNDLHTGQVIASYFVGKMSPLFIPVMFFLSSFTIAFAIGSSWGTMAIMFPITVNFLLSMIEVSPVEMHDLPLLCPTLGAVLSGCIGGDHLSPISNTSILSASSCRITPAKHFETQIWYGAPMVLSATIAYLVLGYGIHQDLPNALSRATFTGLISLVTFFTLGHWGHRLLRRTPQRIAQTTSV